MIKKFLFILLIPAIFLFDRILKIFVVQNYREGGGFPVVSGIFHVTRVNNTGAAFGILKNSGIFLVVVSVISVFFLSFYLFRGACAGFQKKSSQARALRGAEFAWALVIAGALGNLYDRLHYGYVIDFLDLRVWPVFNVADASICLGVFWIVLDFLKNRIFHGKNAPDSF